MTLPIIVERPLSCFAKDVGAPLLDLEFLSSASNIFQIDCISCTLSFIILPQLIQTISPDSGLVSILVCLLHNEHSINEDELIVF